MRPRKTDHDQLTINALRRRKVLTIGEISELLELSIATLRRRMRDWECYSSYNHGGQYYTLPSIPRFDKQGLWKYEGAYFSKHRTLKNTIVHLVGLAPAGLSNAELEHILGVNPNSYLPQLKALAGIRRERHKREVVYFSSDDERYRSQTHNRFPPEPTALKLPPDALAIIVLVELIKHPGSTPLELSRMLTAEGYDIDAETIENLFAYHGLKKKLNTSE